jgi:hypothetical protein
MLVSDAESVTAAEVPTAVVTASHTSFVRQAR